MTSPNMASAVISYTKVTSTAASSGDNTLVAAPAAGSHIVVKDIIVQNESSTDTTVILKSGSASVWRAKLLGSLAASLAMSFRTGEEWRLGSAEALVLNLSGANSHGYSVRYRVEVDG